MHSTLFAVFDLMQGGKIVSRNLHLFDRTRNLALPVPAIQAEFKRLAPGRTRCACSQLFWLVMYTRAFGDNEVDVSDNYFDLLPGEAVTLQLKSKAEPDQLRRSLKVRNITDAVPCGFGEAS